MDKTVLIGQELVIRFEAAPSAAGFAPHPAATARARPRWLELNPAPVAELRQLAPAAAAAQTRLRRWQLLAPGGYRLLRSASGLPAEPGRPPPHGGSGAGSRRAGRQQAASRPATPVGKRPNRRLRGAAVPIEQSRRYADSPRRLSPW